MWEEKMKYQLKCSPEATTCRLRDAGCGKNNPKQKPNLSALKTKKSNMDFLEIWLS